MNQIMQRVKSKIKNKQAFTLIELIVVIAIIAILVAILVPSITKFISSAKQTASNANAKTIFVATQTYITDEYTAGRTVADSTNDKAWATGKLTGYVSGSLLSSANAISIQIAGGAVSKVVYTDSNSNVGTYPGETATTTTTTN